VDNTTTDHLEGEVLREAARRRTFAIISHPDAGKTTLTEKLLFFGNAIDLAGVVRGRKGQRRATSDWMAMEQERGISMTSSVLQFEYGGCLFNLLDTPGHQDFSEDTYRTLFAVDSAIMILDAARGIEPQTRKLFEVCRRRRLPLITFINKLDQPGREPLDLLDEIERTLGIRTIPRNWPVGMGGEFAGLYDLGTRSFLPPDAVVGTGIEEAPGTGVADRSRPAVLEAFHEELRLIEGLGMDRLEPQAFLGGDETPVFFGSALRDYGVRAVLEALIELAPAPAARMSASGDAPSGPAEFSGLVFKIQANMDPRHRDRVAFVRVASGRFSRDMTVYNPRLGRSLRAARLHRFFAGERESAEEAVPGDNVGLINPGMLRLGDTLTGGADFRFGPIPRFPPEYTAYLRETDVSRRKQLLQGLEQLEEEGVLQVLRPIRDASPHPLVAVVGILQLDLVQSRLRSEYTVETTRDPLPYQASRWVHGDPRAVASITLPVAGGSMLARDRYDRPMILFRSPWELSHCIEKNPEHNFTTNTDDAGYPGTAE
jgi:peptide chain release factor 3